MTEKSDKKTQEQFDKILNSMETDTWYKAEAFVNVLGVKLTRTKELLRLLVDIDLFIADKATKGKSYKKRSRTGR